MMPVSVLRLISGSEDTENESLNARDFYVQHQFCPLNYTDKNYLAQGWARLRSIAKLRHQGADGDRVHLLASQPINFVSHKNHNPRTNTKMEGWTEEAYKVPDGVIIRLQYKLEKKKFGSRSHSTAMVIRTRLSGAKQQIRFTEDIGLPHLAIGYFDVLSADYIKNEKLITDPKLMHLIGDTLRDEFISIDIIEEAQYDIDDTTTKIITIEGSEVAIQQRKRRRSVTS